MVVLSARSARTKPARGAIGALRIREIRSSTRLFRPDAVDGCGRRPRRNGASSLVPAAATGTRPSRWAAAAAWPRVGVSSLASTAETWWPAVLTDMASRSAISALLRPSASSSSTSSWRAVSPAGLVAVVGRGPRGDPHPAPAQLGPPALGHPDRAHPVGDAQRLGRRVGVAADQGLGPGPRRPRRPRSRPRRPSRPPISSAYGSSIRSGGTEVRARPATAAAPARRRPSGAARRPAAASAGPPSAARARSPASQKCSERAAATGPTHCSSFIG